MRTDLFDSLPRPTVLLLLSSILELTYAHALQPIPREAQAPTATIPYRALSVVSWPLHPTPPPSRDLFALRRQQVEENTVCGYIGGDSALPATCGSGSHCALDTEHNVVGCCPNGIDTCTAGIFTGCVDANSGPQTEVNPYVFSCSGAAVCYKNIFDGGFSQFGCGTASDQATSVKASASGITSLLTRPTITVSYTQSISTLSEPTTLGTITSSSSASASSTSSSSSSTIASSSTSEPAKAASPAATSSAAASPATNTSYRTGAIIGATIGGLAVLIAIAAFAFLLLRRRNANTRQGPGPGGMRGKRIGPPMGGSGTGFAALAQESHDAFETGPVTTGLNQNPMTGAMSQPPMAMKNEPPMLMTPANANRSLLPPIATHPPMPFQSEISPIAEDPDLDQDRSPFAYSGGGGGGGISSASVSSYPPSSSEGPGATAYHYPGQYPAVYAGSGAAAGGAAGMGMDMLMMGRVGHERLELEHVPLTREIDDFSQGFTAALGRIGEEDEEEVYRDHDPGRTASTTGGADGGIGGQGQAQAQAQEPGQPQESETGSTHDSNGSMRPLWQQNRRQSRNLMWM